MTDDRFNELINGPMSHPMFPFRFLRVAQALRAVVAATGAAGDAALEAYCKERELMDRVKDGEYADVDDASAARVADHSRGEREPV